MSRVTPDEAGPTLKSELERLAAWLDAQPPVDRYFELRRSMGHGMDESEDEGLIR